MEGVAVALEQRQVGVHRRAGQVGERLGHEGRVHALGQRHLPDDVPQRHDVVGHRQGVGVAQVDLLLAGRDLVVAELHRDAHGLQREDRLAAEVVGDVVRGQVEVAAGVGRLGRRAVGRQVLQQEELDLGVGVEGEPHVGGLGQRPAQHVPRVGPGRRAVGQRDVAEHPRGVAGLPLGRRHHLEGAGVGLGEHVGLVDAGEPLDRRAVEADALGERGLDLGRGHRDGLQVAGDVGEPQPHEADVALFEGAQDELLLSVHARP